jgi:cardiolipin synthase A/B
MSMTFGTVILIGVALGYGLGLVNAAHAVMHVRSSRGAIAWSMALTAFPWLAIPLYWVFGRNKFQGYAEALRRAYIEHHASVHEIYQEILQHQVAPPIELSTLQTLADKFSLLPFTSGNQVELLLNGQATYDGMLMAIASAKSYILLQSYTIEDDDVGNRFSQALITQAKQGVRIYCLWDGLGSIELSSAYVKNLRDHGIQVGFFKSTKGNGNRFQLNFRNHRKILVVDGEMAFVGGLNIGDSYLGKEPPLSPWRDTHLKVQGAAVQCLQSVLLSDWFWAFRTIPEVNWQVKPRGNQSVLIFPTGPADRVQACTLFFVNLINQAQNRIWIASPYFVPDDSVLTALKVAVLRGVDVRIILPNRPDHQMVYLCSFSYYAELQAAGIKLYRYQPGFTHQKVVLVDQNIASVGTVNLDNRSFFLNFEVTAFVADLQFVQTVESMLIEDLLMSRLVDTSDKKRSLGFQLAVKIARLLSPVL